jgi:hypothetical protein
MHAKYILEILRGKDYFDRLDVGSGIILKRKLKK